MVIERDPVCFLGAKQEKPAKTETEIAGAHRKRCELNARTPLAIEPWERKPPGAELAHNNHGDASFMRLSALFTQRTCLARKLASPAVFFSGESQQE